MKILIFLAFMLCNNWLFSQDTIFLDKERKETLNSEDAKYYKLVSVDSNDLKTHVKVFYISGKISSEKIYSDYDAKIIDGISKEWNEDGILKKTIEYKLDKKDGEFTTFWENGTIKRIDVYKRDSLLNGKCFDEKGIEVEYYEYQKMPSFIGGQEGLKKYLSDNIKYPINAQKNKIQGTVYVSFIINKIGEVSDIKISKGINIDLNNEALRVIRNMPNWNPGLSDGKPVKVSFILPIKFSL